MILYLLIFLSKVIENTLSTLRLIIVASGKKLLGAILNFLIALIWIFSTGAVIVNINTDPLKIIFFALGSFFGSYIGSIIEEKVALGNNMLFTIINKNIAKYLVNTLKKQNHIVTIINSDKNDDKIILIIILKRKQRKNVVNLIRQLDKKSIIISENVWNMEITN
ncbi:MAG: DUF5698 domain-containing protein [Bacilli bacterium]